MTVTHRLTIDELGKKILNNELSSSDLTREQLVQWFAWEPSPVKLTSFQLSDEEHRQEFLWEYYWQGEQTLFAAVAHVWDSLEGERQAHCTLVGVMSGTGGKGKTALVLTLQQFLRECLDGCNPLPLRTDYSSLDDWNDAVRQSFLDDEQQARDLCRRYAAILDGRLPDPTKPALLGQVLQGVWQ